MSSAVRLVLAGLMVICLGAVGALWANQDSLKGDVDDAADAVQDAAVRVQRIETFICPPGFKPSDCRKLIEAVGNKKAAREGVLTVEDGRPKITAPGPSKGGGGKGGAKKAPNPAPAPAPDDSPGKGNGNGQGDGNGGNNNGNRIGQTVKDTGKAVGQAVTDAGNSVGNTIDNLLKPKSGK